MECFRLIDKEGNCLDEEQCKQVDPELLNRIFEEMMRLEEVDSLLYMAQRQGKISFYMTSFGE